MEQLRQVLLPNGGPGMRAVSVGLIGGRQQHEVAALHALDFALGDTQRLPPRVRQALADTVAATRENRTMTVALALSYGGRQDIVNAARAIARAVAEGELSPDGLS